MNTQEMQKRQNELRDRIDKNLINWMNIQEMQKRKKELGESIAKSLTNWTGVMVTVKDDLGDLHNTRAASEPWLLGGHTWVIDLEPVDGKEFRAYDLTRLQKIQISL